MCHAVESHDKRLDTLLGCRIEGSRQILRESHVEKLNLDTERLCRSLYLFPLKSHDRVTHIEEARDSGEAWNQLSKQFHPLGINFDVKETEPGYVPAWVR